MFRKIMVPVDGSPTSNLGLEAAIKLAKDQKATLFLFHVVDEALLIQDSPVFGASAYIDRLLTDLVSAGKQVLADAEAKVRKHRISTRSLLLENVAASTADLIVKQAKKWKADLIVLGTHGRRGIRRLVMGSDAEGVIRTTPVPVLLVRATARAPRRTVKGARKN